MVDKVINELKRGKAAGLDTLTAEHLQYSNPYIATILSKVFNWILTSGHIPPRFGMSYTVPLLKGDSITHLWSFSKRWRLCRISISPVISKVLGYCIIEQYSQFLNTTDNQFGFKKQLSCSHVILVYAVCNIIDHFISGGSIVNVWLLDVSKAFDKMSHYALYIKLINHNIPLNLLKIIENWFNTLYTCVRWGRHLSTFLSSLRVLDREVFYHEDYLLCLLMTCHKK